MKTAKIRRLIISVIYLCHVVCFCVAKDDYDADMDDAVSEAEAEMKHMKEADEQAYDKGVDSTRDDTVEHKSWMFSCPSSEAMKMGYLANLQLKALKWLIKHGIIESADIKINIKFKDGWKKKFKSYCAKIDKDIICDKNARYRSADGTCNNLYNPTWGSAMSPQVRLIPPMYDDEVDSPRQTSKKGNELPSPRLISNIVFKGPDNQPINNKRTIMLTQWGQFIDHEFIKTPIHEGVNGSSIECCKDTDCSRPECFPISIPENDPHFTTSCMNFVRSLPALNLKCDPGWREQIDQVTSFIDGSAVYGSSLAKQLELRTGYKGLLKTLHPNLLPPAPPTACTLKFPSTDTCQKAGDERSNVAPFLGWSHTTFMREHNRIATKLHYLNPHWSDEKIFQEARRIIPAIMQHINYNQYLDAFLNNDTMTKYNLRSAKNGYDDVYNEKVNPTVANAFGAAAFRHGHSQILNYQATMDKAYSQFTSRIALVFTLMDPHMIRVDNGAALDGMARWLVADPNHVTDRMFVDGIRDRLFEVSPGDSFDLPALNIQRGRDHGLPSYTRWRKFCGLSKVKKFRGLKDHDKANRKLLKKAYRHVKDIDLFAGGITETHLPDSFLGPTFTCILGIQFKNFKEGDRYWYETSEEGIKFTPDQLAEIKKITYAKVICDNYDIDKIQPNVFKVPDDWDNKRVPCDAIPGIDLGKWKEHMHAYH